LISWLGDDHAGHQCRTALETAGVNLDGVVTYRGSTGRAWLFYDHGGRSMSFLDPGSRTPLRLSASQSELVRRAAWICLAAAPATAITQAMDVAAAGASLAWIVKADHDCFPPQLVNRLLRRSSVVTHNLAERAFLAPAGGADAVRPGCLLAETNGPCPIRFRIGEEWREEPVEGIHHVDTTGAGDVFAGGLVAHMVLHPSHYAAAVAAGKHRAKNVLVRRRQDSLTRTR